MGTKHGHSMTCAHLLCSQLVSSHLMCLSSSQLSWRRLTGLPRPLPESDDKFCFLSSLRLTLGQQINTCGDILCRQIKNSDLSIFLHTYSHNCLDSILKRTLAAFFSFCCFVYPSTCSKSWFQELCILQRRMSFENLRIIYAPKDFAVTFALDLVYILLRDAVCEAEVYHLEDPVLAGPEHVSWL